MAGGDDMPGIITKVMRKAAKQTAVYWEKTGSDDKGRPVYTDPVEIACRWEDRETEKVSVGSRLVTARSYIMTVTPIKEGSLLMLGTIATWKAMPTYPNLPTYNQGSREVLRVDETPDLKAISTLYEVRV